MKKERIFIVFVAICFVLSLIDVLLTNFLLQTNVFRELNPLAFPLYALFVPLLFFAPKNDKVILYSVMGLSIWLFIVVVNNALNLFIYLAMVS